MSNNLRNTSTILTVKNKKHYCL